MAAVFLKLLNLSISASWLVLAVLVLRLISKRSPKWMNVLLWGIVALRLMLPFSIESALSLIPSAETVSPAVVQFDPAPTITSGVNIIDNAVNPSLSEHFAAAPTMSVNPLYVWTYLAGWVWLIGLGAMLLYALVSYLRLRRRALTFPENYYEEMAGKDVVFAVTVNSISTYDREKAREELEQSAKETYNSQVAAELIDTLKQSSTIKDAPSGMVDRMNQTLISNVTAQAGAYGMDAGAFVAAVYGGTADNYEETLRTYSQDVANQYMILAAIAEKENITVTDEEVTEDIRASLGADATDDEVASMMESIDEEAYREYLLTMKVCDFLAENAVTAEK